VSDIGAIAPILHDPAHSVLARIEVTRAMISAAESSIRSAAARGRLLAKRRKGDARCARAVRKATISRREWRAMAQSRRMLTLN
jgi:hypothetical protein